jgi:hypothetical protein
MTRATPLSNWGGRRKGAGRKRELGLSDRREIANNYFARMKKRRNREAAIRKLVAEYNVTHRMVIRCVAEFLPDIRWNAKMYNHAIKGAEIQPLGRRNINKLKPGVYAANKQLRLEVNSACERRWIYRIYSFRIGSGSQFVVRDMVLGGSSISLATALKRATNASRMVRRGKNPIDTLRSAKCNLDFGTKLLARGGNVRKLANHLPQLRRMVRCRNPKYLSRSRIA